MYAQADWHTLQNGEALQYPRGKFTVEKDKMCSLAHGNEYSFLYPSDRPDAHIQVIRQCRRRSFRKTFAPTNLLVKVLPIGEHYVDKEWNEVQYLSVRKSSDKYVVESVPAKRGRG